MKLLNSFTITLLLYQLLLSMVMRGLSSNSKVCTLCDDFTMKKYTFSIFDEVTFFNALLSGTDPDLVAVIFVLFPIAGLLCLCCSLYFLLRSKKSFVRLNISVLFLVLAISFNILLFYIQIESFLMTSLHMNKNLALIVYFCIYSLYSLIGLYSWYVNKFFIVYIYAIFMYVYTFAFFYLFICAYFGWYAPIKLIQFLISLF